MPITSSNSVEFISLSAEQTSRLGMRLGRLLGVGSLVCLVGDLGAGKTTFVKGLAAGWGSFDTVVSPTFQLVNEYLSAEHKKFFHLDTYRVESLLEAEELDIDTMLYYGAVGIEWADRVEALLPPERMWIQFDYLDETRRGITFTANGKSYIELLDQYRRSAFQVG